MNKEEAEQVLITIFPDFKKLWEDEDIYRENDKLFTAHGLMRSFMLFFNENHNNITISQLERLGLIIEENMCKDPDGKTEITNAIISEFLELLNQEASYKINSFLPS